MITYDHAQRWLANRINILSRDGKFVDPKTLPNKVKANAVWQVGGAEDRMVSYIRTIEERYARGEISLADAKEHLRAFAKGMPSTPAPAGVSQAAWDQAQKVANCGNTMRLNLILRTTAAQATAVGDYARSRDPDIEEAYPAWRYIAEIDGASRPAHAALHNKVFMKSDPIWHKIYPPWDFNCRCRVEDVSLEEAEQYGGITRGTSGPPDNESGYAFDPADAFAKIELDRIENPTIRAMTKEGVELALGAGAEDRHGIVLRPITERPPNAKGEDRDFYNRPYPTAKELGMPPATTWTATNAPEITAPKEAENIIVKGFKAFAKDGSDITFDNRLFDHWKHDKTDDLAHLKASRLPQLDRAIETVQNPNERWDQEGQRNYLKRFVDANDKETYLIVTVENDGSVRTFYNTDHKKIEKIRKGISHEIF